MENFRMRFDSMVRKLKHMNSGLYTISVSCGDEVFTEVITPANLANNCYSVAKSFTMTAIGILYDRGMLSDTEDIYGIFEKQFPEGFDENWKKVRICDALTHRIGFAEGFLDIDCENILSYGTDDFLNVVLSHKLDHAPGTYYAYSDAAFYLLSRVVSAKTGEKLDDFLMRELFNPLEFNEMAWSKCPKGYPMGATGLYIRTPDMLHLPELYLNKGVWHGKRIISEKWCSLVLENGYTFSGAGKSGSYSKGGMYGQQIYFDVERRLSAAWHGFRTSDEVMKLVDEL